MTLDFRCDKCGKMLKLHSDPGGKGKVRCINCGKWTKVPALLRQLPHPAVEPQAGRGGVVIEVHGEPEQVSPVALAAIGASMPWVLSVVAHVGIFLILVLVVLLSTHSRPVVNPGIAVDPPPPPTRVMGNLKQQGGGDRTNPAERQKLKLPTTPRDTFIGASNNRVDLGEDDREMPVDGYDPFGGRGPGTDLYGLTPGDPNGGGAASDVVFVVDRSGSMGNIFNAVKKEMSDCITHMGDEQKFHIVLFGDGKTIEGPRRGLIQATTDNKVRAWRFLAEQRATGTTTALVALKRAFEVLADRPASESKLIYLVSDGDFAGMSGGSQYRTADGQTLTGNEAVLQWLADNNKGPKVYIHTVLLQSADATATVVLKRIAESNGGRFKLVSSDE